MGHALGATLHVPHGRAVGLLLPYSIEYVSAEEPARFARLARFLGAGAGDDLQAALDLAERIRGLCGSISLPTKIGDLGVSRPAFDACLEQLVEGAFNDASLLTAARSPSYDDLGHLFECAFVGAPVDF